MLSQNKGRLGAGLMIPCRETVHGRLLSGGFASLNAPAKFGFFLSENMVDMQGGFLVAGAGKREGAVHFELHPPKTIGN